MSAVHPIVVFPVTPRAHPTVASPVADISPVIEVFPPIVAVPATVALPSVDRFPVTAAAPPIVASHVADKSPVISAPSPPVIFPVISAVPPIVVFPVISAFCVTVKLLSTSKFPVISTSHKYHANAEKSPLISVPLDNTKLYSPSNGSESGFVSLIDSSLTSSYCGTNNPWLLTNLTSM